MLCKGSRSPGLGPKFGPISNAKKHVLTQFQSKIPNLTKPTWSQQTTEVSEEKFRLKQLENI